MKHMPQVWLGLILAFTSTAVQVQVASSQASAPSDAMVVGLVQIWVGSKFRGTGILMDDDANTIVTGRDTIDGGGILGITVKVSGDEFYRKADIVAYERNYGLALLWAAGSPAPQIDTSRPTLLPTIGDPLILVGCACVLHDPEDSCLKYGVGFGTVTVLQSYSGNLPHPYGPPTEGLMVVGLPSASPVPLTSGMALFYPANGRLAGIVTLVKGGHQLVVVPAYVVIAMVRSVNLFRK